MALILARNARAAPACVRILLVLAALATGAARAAEFPGGGLVGLDPPPGMLAMPNVPSVIDPDRKATITIEETTPEHAGSLERHFTAETPFGARFSAPEDFSVSGAEARIRRGRAETAGRVMNLWLVFLRRADGVALVTVTASTERYSADVIERSLASLVFRARPTISEELASLDFEVGDLAGFRPVGVVGASALYLTEGPKDVVIGFAQPVLRITQRSERDLEPHERRRVAGRLFGLTEDLDRIERGEESIEGDISLIEGKGVDPVSGQPIFLLQAFFFAPEGAIRAVAMAPLAEADRLRPGLLRLVRSIRPRPR